MNGKPKNQTLKQSALILLFSAVLVKLIGALFKIPLSSDYILGDLGFGYFSSGYDVFTPIYFLSVSGFPVAISKIVATLAANGRYSEVEKTFKVSRRLMLCFGIVCFLGFLICVYPLTHFTDKSGKSLYSYIAIAPSIIFCFIAAGYRGYFEGLGDMRPAAVSNIIEALGKLVLGLGFAFAIIKITGDPALSSGAAIVGISVGTCISALYLKLRYKREKGTDTAFNPDAATLSGAEIVKELIFLSVPIVFASVSVSLAAFIDSVTVRAQLNGIFAQNDNAANGIFSALLSEYKNTFGKLPDMHSLSTLLYGIRSKAYTLFNLAPALTVSIAVGLIPAVTESFAQKNIRALNENAKAALKLTSLICFPLGLGLTFLGERIMCLLFGAGESSYLGGQMLVIYGIAAIFAGFSYPLAGILQAINKQNTVFINVLAGIIVKIVLNLLLCKIESINILGAAYSTLACFFVTSCMHLFALFYKTDLAFKVLSGLLKPAASALICVGAAALICRFGDSNLITLLSVIAAAALYFLFLILFKAFDESDIEALPAGEKLKNVCKRLKIFK